MAGRLVKLTASEKSDIVKGGLRKMAGVYPAHLSREFARAKSRKPMMVQEGRYDRMCVVYGWKAVEPKPEKKAVRSAMREIKGLGCEELIGMAWTSVHAAEELLRKAMEMIQKKER